MRLLPVGIGFAVSGAALYLVLRGVHWGEARSALADANYALLAMAVPVILLLLVVRAHRWRLLFYPDRRVSLFSAFAALNIGYTVGNILPLQMSEIARAYVLGGAEHVPKARVLSTILVERLFDTVVLLALLVVLIPFVSLPDAAIGSLVLFIAALVTACVFVCVAVLDRPRVERCVNWLLRFVPARAHDAVSRLTGSLLDGLSALSSIRAVVRMLIWTCISWAVAAAVVYIMLESFALDVPPSAAPFLIVVTTFAFLIPSSPGAFGVYEAVTIRALVSVFAVDQAAATSYALVAHAMYIVPSAILGAAFFWMYHLSLRNVRTWADTGDDAAAAAFTPQPAPASRAELV